MFIWLQLYGRNVNHLRDSCNESRVRAQQIHRAHGGLYVDVYDSRDSHHRVQQLQPAAHFQLYSGFQHRYERFKRTPRPGQFMLLYRAVPCTCKVLTQMASITIACHDFALLVKISTAHV